MGYGRWFSDARSRRGLKALLLVGIAGLLIGSISFVVAQPPGMMPGMPPGMMPGMPPGMMPGMPPAGAPGMPPAGAPGMMGMPRPSIPGAPAAPAGVAAAGAVAAAARGVFPDWNASQWELYLTLARAEGKIRQLYQNESRWHASLAQPGWNSVPRWEEKPMSGRSPGAWWRSYVGAR